MIPADLVESLRCPQSGQVLSLADAEVLARLNDRISRALQSGEAVRNQGGAVLGQPVPEALVRLDRLLLYPCRDDIPILLAEEAIPL